VVLQPLVETVRFEAKTETDAAIVDEIYASTRAVVIGKRMFDVGFEPWGAPPPFGARLADELPSEP
jgi:hypothetical protein